MDVLNQVQLQLKQIMPWIYKNGLKKVPLSLPLRAPESNAKVTRVRFRPLN